MNNSNPLTINVNDIPDGPLKREKTAAFEEIKRKITGIRLGVEGQDRQDNFFDILFINYSVNISPFVSEMTDRDRLTRMWNFKSSCSLDYWNWFKNLCEVNNKRDINTIRDIWIFIIDRFNINETAKFREIKGKIQELERELENDDFNSDDVLNLTRELELFHKSYRTESLSSSFKVSGSFFSKKIIDLVASAKLKLNARGSRVPSPSSPPPSPPPVGGSRPSSPEPPPRRTPSPQPPNTIKTAQTKAISEIETELTKTPSIDSQELEPAYRDYKNLIEKKDNEPAITDFCHQVLSDIRNKRADKIAENELVDLIRQAQGKNNYEELESLIQEIEKYYGKPTYKNHQGEIDALKKRLGNLNLTKYKQTIIGTINNQLSPNKIDGFIVKIEDLEPGNRNFVAEITAADTAEIVNEIQPRILENINQNRVDQELAKLLLEAKNATTQEEKSLAKQAIINFINDRNNHFKQEAYNKNETQIDAILAQLENPQNTKPPRGKGNNDNNNDILKYLAVGGIGLFALALLIVVLCLAKKKKKT